MRRTLLLSLMGSVGLLIALLIGSAVASAAPPSPERHPLPPNRVAIRWQPAAVTARLAPGVMTYETDVAFTSAITLSNVTLVTRASDRGSIEVTPSSFPGDIQPGTRMTVTVRATAAAGSKARQLSGMVQVVQNGRALSTPLSVLLALTPPPAPRPQVIWSTTLISVTVSAGTTVTTPVTFTSNVTLTSAAAVAVLPPLANGAIQAIPRWSGELAPGTTAALDVVVTMPAGPRYRVTGAVLQVHDGRRMIPTPLPVRVNVAGPPVQPPMGRRR